MRGIGSTAGHKFNDAGLDRLIAAARSTPTREHTFAEIGRAAGVTDVRIGQIVQAALKKLRKHALKRTRDEFL